METQKLAQQATSIDIETCSVQLPKTLLNLTDEAIPSASSKAMPPAQCPVHITCGVCESTPFDLENIHRVNIALDDDGALTLTWCPDEDLELCVEVGNDSSFLQSLLEDGIDSITPDMFYGLMLSYGALYINGLVIGLAGATFYTEEQLQRNPLIWGSHFTQDFAIQSQFGTYCELVPTSTFRSTEDIVNYFNQSA